MEWERAKNILIIVLIFLNSLLLALNYYNKKEKMVTTEELQTIKAILADNDIEVNCQLPADNSPSRLIEVVGASWDVDYLKNTFFINDSDVTRTNEAGSVIYRSNGKTAIVHNALSDKKPVVLTYTESIDNGLNNSLELAERYKAIMGDRFKNFRLISSRQSEYKHSFLYNDTKGNKAVFCSSLQIEISDGFITITAKQYNFSSYVDGINQLYKVDEALLAFMHYAEKKFSGKITVNYCDLGYDIDETSNTEVYKARLYYRIFMTDIESPVFVDAVTNIIKED